MKTVLTIVSVNISTESTKQKPSSKKVELFGDDNDEDGEDGDLFSEKSVSKKPVHAPNKEKVSGHC